MLGLRGRCLGRTQAAGGLDGSELAPQLRLAGLDRRRRGTGARGALSLDQARTGGVDIGIARTCPRSGPARAIFGGRASIRGSLPATAGAARSLDQARSALNGENGSASAGAVFGAVAD